MKNKVKGAENEKVTGYKVKCAPGVTTKTDLIKEIIDNILNNCYKTIKVLLLM